LSIYSRALNSDTAATSAFLKTLARFKTPVDYRLITTNNRLVARFNQAVERIEKAEVRELLAALGLSA
jgi:hypothetical protein